MNDLKKLKPCPYCGNIGPMLYKQNNGLFYVHCGRYLCDTKFKTHDNFYLGRFMQQN